MVSPPVRLLGLLVPVLVIPLGLLALKVLGIVAIFMVVELARIPVLYSLSVAAVSFVVWWTGSFFGEGWWTLFCTYSGSVCWR